MSGPKDMSGEWGDRRRRKLRAWWRSLVARVHTGGEPILCMFCDFEGGYAGDEGERHADAGMAKLLTILDSAGLAITFNVVAELCQTHPQRVRRLAAEGHEIGCHGWRHESPRSLDSDATESMLQSAADAFALLDIQPAGFRSPQSAWTSRLVRQLPNFGYSWSAERDLARGAYRINHRLVRIPVLSDDWDLTESGASVEKLMKKWRDLVNGLKPRQVAAIGMHEWLFGARPDYGAALASFLDWVQREKRVDIYRIGEVARGLPSR